MKKKANEAQAGVSGVLKVNARGFGFVLVPDGKDLFIPLDNLGSAMDGDTVVAEVVREARGKNKNPVGRIVEVSRRDTRDLVGTFRLSDGKATVIPEDDELKRPILIPDNKLQPIEGGETPQPGQMVVVRREHGTGPGATPRGRILEVLGDPSDKGMDLTSIARSKGLKTAFSKQIEQHVNSMKPILLQREAGHREDLRTQLCFTIDPETARDFDDAVSLRQLDNGTFELGVHIADVSAYVEEDSPLDLEARDRGTSVYFVQHVIPMLPERLSNDLCSLRPGEDRPAYSVIMTIGSRGDVRDYRIAETVIHSKQRFTYEEVEAIIDGAPHRYAKTVHLMMMLSLLLRRRREETGSVDFDVPEPVISLDKHGIPYEVRPSERLDAHRLIEEFMLAANRTVARHIVTQNATRHSRARRGKGKTAPTAWPFIYRVHEKPAEEDVRAFLDLLEGLGIHYKVQGELEPEDYRKILGIIENLDFKDFVEKVALRSMTKAVYSTNNVGHFGLAFDAYTHFTSPIRRYADLVIHRLLKRYADGTRPRNAGRLQDTLQQICEHSTAREIRATEAEREYTRLKSIQFLSTKIGETYDGVIAGVTSFGLFVELTHYLIEGLVHVSAIRDDHYDFDKENYQLVGRKTGRIYRLGDPLRVRIKGVSPAERKADFTLAG
ncbi:MAG: ribonuclease R [Spirochaetaceae bacterium]|nr:MAG: ribonuclease R [Spirochaetaceae bacterium]